MAVICLGFCGGAAITGALSAQLTSVPGLIGAAIVGFAVVAGLGRHGGDQLQQSGAVVALAVGAFCVGAAAAAMAWNRAALPESLDGAELRLIAIVRSVSDTGAFVIAAKPENVPGLPRRTYQVFPTRGQPLAQIGQRVAVSGTLALPRPPGNPGGFDYAVAARAGGIAGTIDANTVCTITPAPLWYRIAALPALASQRAATALRDLFPEPDATLISGLIFGGDSSRLPRELAANFRRAGLLHLLAASGSNVAFIFGAAIWALRRFLPSSPAYVAGLGIVVFYWLMTGGGASIGRATLMAAIVIVARLARRRPDSLTSLAVAAAVLTMTSPLIALDAGFQLSFGATWGLLVISPVIRTWLQARHLPGWLVAPLAVTLAAQAGVLPVAMNLFGEQSLISPLTNLLALPLAGGAVVTGSLCCLLGAVWPPLAIPVAAPTSVMLWLLKTSVTIGAGLPLATIALPAMPLLWATAYYGWVITTARREKAAATSEPRPGARFAERTVAVLPALLIAAVALMATRPAHSGPGRGLRVTFIDVRQGDSALIEFPDNRRMLVDCGDFAGNPITASGGNASAFGPGGKYDAAGRAIIPYLRRSNVRSLAAAVITHDHADHNGGLSGVKSAIHVGSVLTAGDLIAGRSYVIGGARLEVLWPAGSGDAAQAKAATGNDDSVVLRLTYQGKSVLFTGDCEAAAEAGMLNGRGAGLSADVLKVAHHGGAGSSGDAFLAAVRPRLAVISVGARNSFGHPSLEALARLSMAGAHVLRTDRDGAIRVAIESGGLTVWHWDGRRWRIVSLTGTRRHAAKPNQPWTISLPMTN